MAKKQIKKTNKATLIPLAVGVGVGALYGVNVPLNGDVQGIVQAKAEEGSNISLALPKEGVDYTKEAGDTTHYNIMRDGTTIEFHNGLRRTTTYIAPTNYTIKDVTEFKGERYAAVVGKYDTKIIKYDPASHLWVEQAVLDSTVYNLFPTEAGLVAGGGKAGTYGADFRLYTSGDGKTWTTPISGYRSFQSTTSTNIGFFYTGTKYKEGSVVFGGSGNWTFVRESQDNKTFNFKEEIYGTYQDSVNGAEKVVAVGSQATTNDPYGSIAVSDNGGAFKVTKLGVGEILTSVTYGNGKFVAVGESYYLGALSYTSTDGVNWTRQLIQTQKKVLRDVEWDAKNERFVTVGDGGKMLLSKDGQTWVNVSTTYGNNIPNIFLGENTPDDYDYAVAKFEQFRRDVQAFPVEKATPEIVAEFEKRYQDIRTEAFEKVTNENLVKWLNNEGSGYLNTLKNYSIIYKDFAKMKESVEAMPSDTLEEITAQINEIKKFESEMTATKYPSPTTAYIASFKTTYTSPYIRQKEVLIATKYVEVAEKTLAIKDYEAAYTKTQALTSNESQPLLRRLSTIKPRVDFEVAKEAIETYRLNFTSANENLARQKMQLLVGNYQREADLLFFKAKMSRANELLDAFSKNPSVAQIEPIRGLIYNTSIPDDASRQERIAFEVKMKGEFDTFGKAFLPKEFARAMIKFSTSDYGNFNTIRNAMNGTESMKLLYEGKVINQMEANRATVLLVETAEATPTDANKTKALTAVNALGTNAVDLKPLLLKRLENLNGDRFQKEAESTLVLLTQGYNEELVKKAEEAIAQVKDATEKAELTAELEAVKQKEVVRQAADSVVTAEQSPSYDTVEKATALVEKVTDATMKETLENRLDVIVEELKVAEVLSDIVSFEENPDEASKLELLNKISTVKDSEKQTELKQSVETIWNEYLVQVATTAIEKAETSLSKEDYQEALAKLDTVVEETVKSDLNKRLEEVAYKILVNDVTDSVSSLEKTLNPEYVKTVQEQIETLRDGETKDKLVERVAQVQQVIWVEEAKVAVTELEATPNQDVLDEVKASLSKIRDGFEKTDLESRIETVQEKLFVDEAQKAASLLEENPTQEGLNNLKKQVEALKDSSEKTDLLSKVNTIQEVIFLNEAEKLVEKAMEESTQANLDLAKEAVAKMANSTEKTDLLESIDLMQQVLDAEPIETMLEKFNQKLESISKKPKKSEAEALTAEYNTIVKAVDGLKTGVVKDELKKELTETKKVLDSVIKNGNHPNQAPGQAKKTPFLVRLVLWVAYSIFGR